MTHTRTARAPQPSTQPRQAAIYLRISRDDQGDELGVRRQQKLCEELAARRGWSISVVLTDNDISATSGKRRPGYDRLRKLIAAGEVDGIIAYNPDRLVRRMRDLEDLIDLLTENDIPVETVRGGTYDLTTANGRGQARMAGVWASMEAEKMSERLIDKHAQIAERGESNGGRRSFGYCDDRITPHPVEGPIVVEVVGRIAAGESLGRIAADLNARDIHPTGGGDWSPTQVRRLAVNERYIARRFHNGVDVGPAAWPMIPGLDEATWRRARAIVTDPARTQRRAARRYILSGGLIRCSLCGIAMAGRQATDRSGTSAAAYSCNSLRGGCGRTIIRAERVEALIIERAIELIEGPKLVKVLDAKRAGGDKAKALAVEKLRNDLARWDALADAGDLSPDEWLARRRGTQTRLDAALASMDADTSAAAITAYVGKPGALSAVWDDLSLDRRQAILRAVLDHVEIVQVGSIGPQFNPERVVPHWSH